MVRWLNGIGVALVLALGMTSVAAAQDSGKVEAADASDVEKVAEFVGSSQFILSRSELRELAADPVPALIEVASAKRTGADARENAIKSLALFRDDRVKAAFPKLLAANKNTKQLNTVAMAYLEAFGEDAVADLEPLLKHKDANIRAMVVRGFGLFGGQKGYDRLREVHQTETDERVLQAMRPYVQ